MALLQVLGLTRRQHVDPGGASAAPAAGSSGPAPRLPTGVTSGPKLLSIAVGPNVTTIDAETHLRLVAIGTYENSGPMDISMAVEWDSSAPSAIEVDGSGVALAHAVSGKATITATDPDTGVSGSREFEVRFMPTLGPATLPKLMSIEIRARRSDLHVTDAFEGEAIGVYADSSRRDITNSVKWRSSVPAVLDFGAPLLPGVAYCFAAGRSSITAAEVGGGNVASAPLVVNVTVKAPPPPPPRRLENVEISTTRNGDPSYWIVNEAFAYRATGIYSDKSRQDVTKSVEWRSETPRIAAVDPSGNVKALTAGTAVVFAGLSALGPSLRDRYFYVPVMGAASKTPPKVPPTGALTDKTARALVASLVDLAQYRHDTEKPPAIKAKPTGDARLDAVLSLVADVVRQWGSDATILQARQTWAALLPRLVALLGEAAKPPVALTDKDLNPGRDALNDMNAWVQGVPGNRQIQQNYTRKTTPFGELSIWREFIRSDGGHYGPEDVLAFLAIYEEARVLRTELTKHMRTLDGHAKRMKKEAGDLETLKREVKSRASPKAEQEDKHYQAALRDLKIVQVTLHSFQQHLSDAKVQVDIALTGAEAADTAKKAHELREAAEQQSKQIDACLSVMKLGATMMTLQEPEALLEVFDVVKDLRGLFAETSLAERAAELEKRAAELGVEHAQAALTQARVNVDEAEKLLKEAEDLKAKVSDDMDMLRVQAENAYDGNAQTFQFKDVRAAIEAADAAEETGRKAIQQSARARNGAAYFAREVDFAHRPRFEGTNAEILQAIGKDAQAMNQTCTADVEKIVATRAGWRQIRATAHRALFTSKDPRKKPAKAP